MEIYFKEGDSVCHKDKLDIPMEVIRVIKEFKTFNTIRNNSILNEKRSIIKGIECGWWGPDKQYYKNVFHSNSLIPADIGDQGFIVAEKYIMARAVYKQQEKEKRQTK